jgi:hypothetical protein
MRRRPFVVGSVALVAVVLGGCSKGSGSASSSASPSATASSGTSPQGGASTSSSKAAVILTIPVDAKGHISGAEFLRTVNTRTRTARTAHVTLTSNQQALRASGTVDLGNLSESLDFTSKGRQMKLLLVSDTFYLSSPTLPLPRGKEWLGMAPNAKDKVAAAFRPVLQLMKQANSSQGDEAAMTGVVVSASGQSTLRGAHVRKFTWTQGPAQVAATAKLLPPAQRAAVLALAAGSTSTTVLFLDDSGLPLRVESTVKLKGKAPATTVTEYSHWGEPATIVQPAPATVLDSGAIK